MSRDPDSAPASGPAPEATLRPAGAEANQSLIAEPQPAALSGVAPDAPPALEPGLPSYAGANTDGIAPSRSEPARADEADADSASDHDEGPRPAGGRLTAKDSIARRCALTRVVRPTSEMLRFVLDPNGILTPDLKANLPGRGVWLEARRPVVALARRKGVFARAFKAPAKAPEDLEDRIEAMLARDALAALSLAKKAGAVSAGFVKVEALASKSPVAALLIAREASPDGARKMAMAVRRGQGDAFDAIAKVTAFDGDELGMALGREHVIHGAMIRGALTEKFLARSRRLEFYRDARPVERSDPANAAVKAKAMAADRQTVEAMAASDGTGDGPETEDV